MSKIKKDAIYWKNKAEEIEKELEDFRESSSMLEKELEGSLEQADKTIKELRFKNNSMQLENDHLKEIYEELRSASEAEINELKDEKIQSRKREEDYVKYIRELEQKNDDLERSQRALCTSLGEFEAKLNNALERNVLLESELDDKESLKVMVQRLKDEARDLKLEVQVRERNLDTNRSMVIDSIKMENMDGVTNGNQSSPNHNNLPPLKNLSAGLNNNGVTNSRISAMNIVGDLLRRVGVLESKLASPNTLKGRICNGTSSPGETVDRENNTRSSRLNRGTSTPSIHNLLRS